MSGREVDYRDKGALSLLPFRGYLFHSTGKMGKKGKVLIIYIAVLRNLGLLQDRFNNTPLDHWAHTRQLQVR